MFVKSCQLYKYKYKQNTIYIYVLYPHVTNEKCLRRYLYISFAHTPRFPYIARTRNNARIIIRSDKTNSTVRVTRFILCKNIHTNI